MKIDTINRHYRPSTRRYSSVRRLDSYPTRRYAGHFLKKDDVEEEDKKEELTAEEMEFIKKLFAKKEAILEFLEKADEEPVEEEKEEEVVEEEIEPDEEEVEEPIEEEVEEFETDDEEDEKFFNSKSKKSRDSKQLSSVGTPLKKRESKDVDNSSLLNSFNSRFR